MGKAKTAVKKLTPAETDILLNTLKSRFEKNMRRHQGIEWKAVEKRLLASPDKLWSLQQMEDTGGEPDVVALSQNAAEIVFVDCSPETPKGRRSICYDDEALAARKENKPANSAVNLANEIGIELLTEEQYRQLQQTGEYDLKTSSWIKTTDDVRKLGGGLFCDRRYNKVFLYHNGADSYYAARAFRGLLHV